MTYAPTDTVGATFNLTTAKTPYADSTLLDALNFGGGPGVLGGEQILLKQAVAGLLNTTAGLDYGATPAEVINLTRNPILSGLRTTMINRANEFDIRNNIGCPLS